MSLRTPLGKVLGLGSAREGTDHWWAQRVTGVANLLLGLWFVYALLTMESFQFQSVARFFEFPINSVLMSLLCVTLAYHSYLGIQVVIEDYVDSTGRKFLLLILSRFAHVFVAVACVFSILSIPA